MIFESRQHVGRLLAEELKKRNVRPDLVYGLTRGGVVVAAEVAAAFKIPLTPLVVRKISPPENSEFAVGALAAPPDMEGSEPSVSVWWDKEVLRRLNLSDDWQKQQIKDKKIEILEYLHNLSFSEAGVSWRRQETPDNKNSRSVINLSNIVLVDDGAATGATMMAAIGIIKTGVSWRCQETPDNNRIIVVLPVASSDAAAKIKHQADETIILDIDPDFRAVGQYYREFNQVSWDEVNALLQLNNEAYRKTHSGELT